MSVATFDPNQAAVTMTDAALAYFEKAKPANANPIIRLSTEVSGCTGYAYVLDWADKAQASDEVLTMNEAITLAIDAEALEVLRGTEIDLEVQGVNQVIKFNNPNVVAECGCGESFSVSE